MRGGHAMQKTIHIKPETMPSSLIGRLYFEVDLKEGDDHKKIEVFTDDDGIITETKAAE
jgi:hypothetical protein